MNSRRFALVMTLGASGTLTLILLWMLSVPGSRATAMPAPPLSNAPSPRYVCITGTNSGDCTDSASPCRTVQYAVDQASEGSVIKVASGTYTGVMARPRNDVYSGGIVTQVVHITKSITIQGGYTTTNGFADPPDPIANSTTLDAQGEGRVIYIGRAASVTVAGLHITGGDAITPAGGPYNLDAGGGVYIAGGSATLRDNAVFGNVAHYGGGIGVIDGTASLSGNRTFDNVAEGPGGGVYVGNLDYVPDRPIPGTTVAVVGDRIFDNTAGSNGGGLCAANAGYDRLTLDLTDNQMFSNTAAGSGGGVIIGCGHPAYTGGCDETLYGNLVAGNRAGSRGGGMILSCSIPTAFDRNVIISNTAEYGGGLYLSSYTAGTFANTIIVDNWAHTAGSGLYMQASWPHVLHTTVARNRGGDGSGIYIDWDPIGDIVPLEGATLVNTIVASQTVGINNEGVAWSSSLTTELSGVLWFGNGVNISGTGAISVTRAYTGNPDFRDAAGRDYHIGPDSAAIDVGVNAGVHHDMDGEPRPFGAGYDIGADEYTPELTVSKRAYPDPVQPGAALTYTIHVTNVIDGPLHATITDTLPLSVTLGGTLIPPGGTVTPPGGTVILPDGQVAVVWTAVLTAPGGTWMGTIRVTVNEDAAGPLVNTVEVRTEEGVTGRADAIVNAYKVYLPFVLRESKGWSCGPSRSL